ncbi:cupin domain [Hypnocyclicus thermotrophus]|uniref:Cupin domain n=1 Tax=Hypnocyclicus thermotrophus TaxID=1627895 RepID=A0AA46I629_9FUSO|nr:cupin domain-containing protein [Hypnocyclicus thermotrophus]TDT71893.1 cupin domain [Hypnocyclicus thermotrophus]
MLLKFNDTTLIETIRPREGKGKIKGYRYLENIELENNLKGFYVNELEVGSEVGYHQHIEDEEIYYVLEGKGIINDNGEEKEISVGDLIYTKDGERHSIKNTGDTSLKFIAFIIKK